MDATASQQQPPTPSAETPNVNNQEIDRVLRQMRRHHESRSCVPCKRRKVRCDNHTPCTTCEKRGHPEICVYEAPRPSRRATPVQSSSRNKETPANPVRLRSDPSALRPPDPRHLEDNNSRSSLTENYSITSIAREMAQKQANGEELARDVGSVLGLQNSLTSYPFMDLASSAERWCELLKVIPHRQEILSLFPIFQMRVFPFNPLLVDMDQFELDMHGYLRSYTAGEFKDMPISNEWGKERAIGLISLILAVLSSAAHYSDLAGPDRSRVCYDLARRSFQALRLANFLFRPTLEVVQTMLILGNTLQNTGQSDAAWVWLGSTARLAQTLHFYARGERTDLPDIVKVKARTCWSNIIWQDTLLSMCHARRPLTMIDAPMQVDSDCEDSELTYHAFMRAICRIPATALNNDSCDVAGVTTAMLQQLDSLHQRTRPYLQDHDHCKSSLEYLQYLALKMHKCFLVTFLCRPEIRNANRSLNQSPIALSEQQLRIRKRAEDNLIEATKTFLEFRAVSTVPLRSWPMVHTALSSVLLLCIWEETRVKPECQYLREKVIEAFSSPDDVTDDRAYTDGNTQWLSPRHIHALVTLKDAFTAGDSGLQVDPNTMQGWNKVDLLGQSGFIPGINDAWDPFAEYATNDFDQSIPCDSGATNMELPAIDPCPMNYLDFIMRGAL